MFSLVSRNSKSKFRIRKWNSENVCFFNLDEYILKLKVCQASLPTAGYEWQVDTCVRAGDNGAVRAAGSKGLPQE